MKKNGLLSIFPDILNAVALKVSSIDSCKKLTSTPGGHGS